MVTLKDMDERYMLLVLKGDDTTELTKLQVVHSSHMMFRRWLKCDLLAFLSRMFMEAPVLTIISISTSLTRSDTLDLSLLVE